MKIRYLAAVILGASLATSATAQPINADDILGRYLNPDRSRTVAVYKEGNRYFGVIDTAPAISDGNEGVGFVVFRDFLFDPGSRTWEQGRLDSPMQPRINFRGRLSLSAEGDLVVQGVGFAALAGSSVFPRVE